MIVVMEPDAPEAAVERVISFLSGLGLDVQRSSGQSRTILGVVGDVRTDDASVLREFGGVAEVVRVTEPFRLASRRFRQQSTIVEGAWGSIGGERPWVAIEPIGLDTGHGGNGFVDSPRHSELPYEVAAGRPFDAAVSRARAGPESIGSLSCLTLHPNPASSSWPVVFIERAPSWGNNSWIAAAERALQRGEGKVVLLEAGGEYPNGARTLDVAAIARAKDRTHLPIVVDVATIAQRARYCSAVACAAIGAGADGVILRVWVGPDDEVARQPAALPYQQANELCDKLRQVGKAVRG